jgi:hypothetical protein
MLSKLTESQCRAAMAAGEFPDDILRAAPVVVVALTQSWCPQWFIMRPLLEALPGDGRFAAFYVEYDLEPWFEEFLGFKEGAFGNDQVPYLRYYRDGKLFKTSNYLDKSSFLRIVGP